VVDAGAGPGVLLLHGFPDSGYVWRNQVGALVDAGFRVIVPDLRGFGESDKPEGVKAYAMGELLKDEGASSAPWDCRACMSSARTGVRR